MIYCHQLCFKMEEFSKRKQSDSYWSCKRNYWVSSITWITHLLCWLSLVIPSMGLHAIAWDQFARISPISASLNLFARALVTGPMGTRIGSEYVSSHVLLHVSTFSSCFYACHVHVIPLLLKMICPQIKVRHLRNRASAMMFSSSTFFLSFFFFFLFIDSSFPFFFFFDVFFSTRFFFSNYQELKLNRIWTKRKFKG